MFVGTSFGHFLWVIRQRIGLILIVVCVCSGITFLVNNLSAPVYESSALVEVHDTSSANNSVFTDQALAQSYALVVTRTDVLEQAAQQIPGMTSGQLANAVTDSPLNNTQIIEIRATASNGTQAAAIANTVGSVFIQTETNEQTKHLKAEAQQLQKNIISIKEALDNDQALLDTLETQQPRAPQDRITHQDDMVLNDQSNYSTYQTSYNQVEQQLLQVGTTLTLEQKALPSATPTSPKTLLNTLVAAALSLVLMIVLSLLLDWMDTRLKTPDDIEHLAHMIPLGSLPACDKEATHQGENLPLVGHKQIEQSFIGIGTMVSLLRQDARVLLVTGLHKQTGTSTVAANLAISLAHSGVRVLLIDTNIQRPALHHSLQASNTRGLTSILADTTMLKETTQGQVISWLNQWNTRIPNLWLLPAGPASTQPGTILRSPVMGSMIKNLLRVPDGKETHQTAPIEVIIFDAPSLEESSETLAIAAHAEGSILVIEAGKEQSQPLHKAETVLSRLGAPILGVVLNRQTARHQTYFYTGHARTDDNYSHESSLLNSATRLNTDGHLTAVTTYIPQVTRKKKNSNTYSASGSKKTSSTTQAGGEETELHGVENGARMAKKG